MFEALNFKNLGEISNQELKKRSLTFKVGPVSHDITLKSETDGNIGVRPTAVLGIHNIGHQQILWARVIQFSHLTSN